MIPGETTKLKLNTDATRIGVFTFGNGTSEDYIDGRTNIDFNLSTMKAQQLDPICEGK